MEGERGERQNRSVLLLQLNQKWIWGTFGPSCRDPLSALAALNGISSCQKLCISTDTFLPNILGLGCRLGTAPTWTAAQSSKSIQNSLNCICKPNWVCLKCGPNRMSSPLPPASRLRGVIWKQTLCPCWAASSWWMHPSLVKRSFRKLLIFVSSLPASLLLSNQAGPTKNARQLKFRRSHRKRQTVKCAWIAHVWQWAAETISPTFNSG